MGPEQWPVSVHRELKILLWQSQQARPPTLHWATPLLRQPRGLPPSGWASVRECCRSGTLRPSFLRRRRVDGMSVGGPVRPPAFAACCVPVGCCTPTRWLPHLTETGYLQRCRSGGAVDVARCAQHIDAYHAYQTEQSKSADAQVRARPLWTPPRRPGERPPVCDRLVLARRILPLSLRSRRRWPVRRIGRCRKQPGLCSRDF